MPQPAPVVVGLDRSPTDDLALRWAIGHAQATGAPLRLVSAYHWAVIQPWEAPFEEGRRACWPSGSTLPTGIGCR